MINKVCDNCSSELTPIEDYCGHLVVQCKHCPTTYRVKMSRAKWPLPERMGLRPVTPRPGGEVVYPPKPWPRIAPKRSDAVVDFRFWLRRMEEGKVDLRSDSFGLFQAIAKALDSIITDVQDLVTRVNDE